MKIALFSDIHANLPALEAFFEDLETRNVDAIYCLGDLVGYNVWANEVVNEIRNRKIPTIAGNHDEKVKKISAEVPNDKNYAYNIIGDEEKSYLSALPAHIKLTFQLNETNLTLLLVHGSPNSNKEYLLAETVDETFLTLFKEFQTDILCFGHTHKPFHKILNVGVDGKNHFHHAINIGSVGKPKDGDTRGCYVLLTFNQNSSIFDKESIQVEFIRFEYDIEKAAKAIESSLLPNEYAEMLRNAF
ncbi:MAG: metallophosphoesterase family protein [Emticicia sp.]|nr:metallophosphoesterase family protein [Emticicia sp.]